MFKSSGFKLRISMMSVAMAMSLMVSHAQPESLGTTFSYTGFSLSYEHGLCESDSFIEASIKAETSEYFLNRADKPGISGSLTWNFPIKEWISSEGNSLALIAGPGLTCGFGHDFRQPKGLYIGLKGRFGIGCEFARRVIISATISPVIGVHMSIRPEDHNITMKYYINGLIYSLMPEVGIKYAF